MNSSTTISKIAAALLAAQKEMGNAKKEAANPFFKSKFADLNSVREAVTPSLHANGISILQLGAAQDGKSFIQTTLLHESGEFISSMTEVVCAKQNDPQALGSAISYARRYGLSAMLSVGAEDNDAEGAMDRKPAKAAPVIQSGTVTTSAGPAIGNTNITTKTVPGTNTAKPTFRKAAKPKTEDAAKSSDNVDDWVS